MNEPYGIRQQNDISGSNFVIHSSLKRYAQRSVADEFSIKMVHCGTEHYTIDGQYYPLEADQFIVVSPGQQVEVEIDSSTEVEGTCFYLAAELIHQVVYARTTSITHLLENDVKDDVFQHNELNNIPIHYFRTPLHSALDQGTKARHTSTSLTDYLIHLAEDLVSHQWHAVKQLETLESVGTKTKKELYRRVQQGRHFIHDHLDHGITLKDIAKAAGLSDYYFHRNFRLLFNMTPFQYHHCVRMTKAKNLLDAGVRDKTEIADQCGFQDLKYFSRVLKKWLAASSA